MPLWWATRSLRSAVSSARGTRLTAATCHVGCHDSAVPNELWRCHPDFLRPLKLCGEGSRSQRQKLERERAELQRKGDRLDEAQAQEFEPPQPVLPSCSRARLLGPKTLWRPQRDSKHPIRYNSRPLLSTRVAIPTTCRRRLPTRMGSGGRERAQLGHSSGTVAPRENSTAARSDKGLRTAGADSRGARAVRPPVGRERRDSLGGRARRPADEALQEGRSGPALRPCALFGGVAIILRSPRSILM